MDARLELPQVWGSDVRSDGVVERHSARSAEDVRLLPADADVRVEYDERQQVSADEQRAELESWLSFVGHEGWRRLMDALEGMRDLATSEVMEGRVQDEAERSIRVGIYRTANRLISLPAERITELREMLNMEED